MKNIKLFILIFLILGLYIDVRIRNPYSESEPSVCNGDYRQRAILIQVVVPFRPERENFYLAWGNKHYDLESETYTYTDIKTKQKTTHTSYYGCASKDYGFGRYTHLIDLRKFF